MKMSLRIVIALVLLMSVAAFAQTTTVEVKSGEVVGVYGNTLAYKAPDGTVKEVVIPADFKFNVDGQNLTIDQLKPGMKLTAIVTTTTTPKSVKTVKIRNGEVVKVAGSTLMYREGGQVKSVTAPSGFKVMVNGEEKMVQQLTPGMKLTAEVVTVAEGVDVTRTADISGTTPAPPPAPVVQAPPPPPPPPPAPEPEPEPEPAAELPKTASPLPLIGLLGALLAAAGVVTRRLSR